MSYNSWNHILNSTQKKRIDAERNGDKDRKVLYRLINNAIYGKTIENVKNRIDLKLVNTCKDYLKLIFFKLGFTPCKGEQPPQGMELQEKEAQKD